ncbi:porphobilinogen synthase [Anseongella ginsenosidimutans]|uniref:Delta-aminolevulinic acid dehydratase n=1 Tax=Anseongella ginsenosidimutans TaxID=496056 RepID=A0A4R3KNS5_9SPHI|nr:porphobilinogen synthase [Anseongella ginsenosidimutans]QEC53841.1 porphobilinogen synthase [Anseongella ginsenosidimutans]TCS86216.1 porphobilinogen synthase [Anseongella ginsenosidimutans]
MVQRPRRLRKNEIIRDMVAETKLSAGMFVYPYFVVPGMGVKHAIPSMPGIHHFSVDELLKDVEQGLKAGVNKLLLFGVGEEKSADAHGAYDPHSIVPETIKQLRKAFGSQLYIITDVCVCAYTTHGHCGILQDDYVQNDPTLDVLAKMALSHARAGADMVAPSDMMDGRVGAIRQALDAEGLVNTGIMSYAVKFSGAYYGPFREAADSAPGKGDRKSYQLDFRNSREALREAALDEAEGADILMVKPALAYLDLIASLRAATTLPVACYNVSGEFSMVKAAAMNGWADERAMVMENMYAFARAGAGIIITYHTRDILEKNWL